MLSYKPQSTANKSIQKVTQRSKTRMLYIYCSFVNSMPYLLPVDQQYTMEVPDAMQPFEHSKTSLKCSSMFLLNTVRCNHKQH